ncbi:hypothetical protein ACKWTF_011127 [Chironomus riparius]
MNNVTFLIVLQFDDLNLYPRNICKRFGNGKRFPVPYNCNEYIICIDDVMRVRKCPSSHPYFDSCTSSCDLRSLICQRNNCDDFQNGLIVPAQEGVDEVIEDES